MAVSLSKAIIPLPRQANKVHQVSGKSLSSRFSRRDFSNCGSVWFHAVPCSSVPLYRTRSADRNGDLWLAGAISGDGSRLNSIGEAGEAKPLLAFPGGGMFFYWQIGAIEVLSRHYDLSRMEFSGASAGALAATLAACEVDGRQAAQAAFQLSLDNRLWDRPTGLGGIWSSLVREWLHALLPSDAVERCSNRLHIHVLHLPSIRNRSPFFSRKVVKEFATKDDLVECCMASVHIPLFMDGRIWTLYRNRRSIDGSIFASRERMNLGRETPTLYLDYSEDEVMKLQRLRFLSLGKGPDATWQWIEEMMCQGGEYVNNMKSDGSLDFLVQSRTVK